jgi:anti-sigma regulatory factor (Ser/Thr protein kinase)
MIAGPGIARRRVSFRRRLPLDASVLCDVRARLRDYLCQHDVPERAAADVVLCVDEAITNAIRYSRGRGVDVTVRAGSRSVRARVRDKGTGFLHTGLRARPSPWTTGGRGLYIMQSLMDDVSVYCSRGAAVSMWKRLDGNADSAGSGQVDQYRQ